VQIEPKIMDLLVCLIEHKDTTVTKEQFLERVWGDTVVTEDVLTRGISELRKVLGDDPNDPTYVETIHKTGYRLLAPVSYTEPPPPPDSAPHSRETRTAAPSLLSRVRLPSLSTLRLYAERHVRRTVRDRGRRIWLTGLLIFIVGLGGAIWALTPTDPPALPTTAPFTSFPGNEIDPALAPDGHKLAFAWTGQNSDADTDIYVKKSDIGHPLRLTQAPANDYSPAWSPNAEQVAFVRSEDERYSIHLTPLIGGKTQELLHFENRRISGLTWTDSGDALIFSARRSPYGPYILYRLSVETTTHQALTSPTKYYHGDQQPSVNNGTIAFVRSVTPNVEDVYTVPVDGGTPTQLTHRRTDIMGLDWNAKGASIIYATTNRSPRLWKISATGGSSTPVPTTGTGSYVHHPSISQTGRMALTQQSVNVNIWHLRRQKRYNRFSKESLIQSTRWDSNPAISPSGTRIAFASQRSGRFQIWITSRDGTPPTRLTDMDASLVRSPRWGPNGDRIAFMARSDNQSDIYLTSVNGNTARRLTTVDAEDVAPSWSQNGDSLYFASTRSGTWQVWATPTDSTALYSDSSAARRITTNGGFAARESPDGDALFFVKKRSPGIWRLPKSGGTPTRVVDALAPYDWGNWAVTEYGIYFIRRDAARPILAYYSFESNRTFRTAFLEDLPRLPSLAVAPGGEWFLYSRNQSQSDIVLIDRTRS
jgi:Tol biopolymer transport system component/DNA-binding winged helix-turn-helix (wHTH) protein